MNARRLAVCALVVVAAGCLAAAVAARPQASAARTLAQLAGVNFVSACGFSHRAPDDPIVYPGQPGRSHDHSFVGNVSTSASSTLASLQAAGTTCRRPGDTAAYWAPTLLVGGRPLAPTGATIYYRRSTLAAPVPFPSGLRMIAGDSHATAPQDLSVVFWNCGVDAAVDRSAAPPTCPDAGPDGLRLHVTFPSCWDGRSLDSADHRSHLAYPRRGACPAGQPVAVPAITLIYRYPTAGGPSVALSSGGTLTAHADFFNAWRQPALAQLVATCLDAFRHCGRGV